MEKAREMLSQSLMWRKKHQVDKILSEYQTPQVVKDYFPGGWHHGDKGENQIHIGFEDLTSMIVKMWCLLVWYKFTDILGECVAFIFMVKE